MDHAHSLLPLPVGPRQPAAEIAPKDEPQALRDALALPWSVLRFEPALERAYERDTGGKHAKRIFVCNLGGTAYFWLLCTMDLHKLSHIADLLAHLRDGITAICVLISVWQGARLHRLSPLERDGFTAIGALLMCCYAGFEVSQASDVIDVMIGNNVMLVFVFSCLVARLRFWAAVAVTLPTLVGYPLVAFAYDPLTHAIVRNHVALFVGAAAVSLIANYLLERKERRAYLLQRLSLLHRDTLRSSAEALRRLALCDPLTGMANRRHFDREIGKLWHTGAPVGLLQIDVDFFKRYNDRYGHLMGDLCLQQVGARLQNIAQAHGGLAARIGGEEFAVLLPGLDLEGATTTAARVCEAIRALNIAHSESATAPIVTTSVGVASTRPDGANSPASLMLAADLALYRAKREGRNRFAQSHELPTPPEPGAPPLPTAHPPSASDLRPTSGPIEQWSGLLASGLHRLRFPAGTEAAYQMQDALQRQRRLALLVFFGLALACGYTFVSLPLHADIAPEFMRGTVLLCGALALPWTAVWTRPLPWQWREGLLSGTAVVLVLGLLLMESRSASPGMQTGVISLSLVTIVATLIAAPPVRFSLPPCVLLCIGVAALTGSSGPAEQARWVSAFALLLGTSAYSVIGAYLLDFSNRRNYLLLRLSEAQIAELQEMDADLHRLAMTDALTGLPNRRHFEAKLTALWESGQPNDSPLGLLIVDIDHFKPYNDHYGHLAGDACLQHVGEFIADWCARQRPLTGQRVAAFGARLGGEEFGVLLPGHDAESARVAAQALCAELHARRSPHAHSLTSDVLTASIGAASQRPHESNDLRRLLRVADEALYRAKASGRNRAST